MLRGFEMELLNKFSGDYQKAGKKKRGKILSQYCKLSGCDRWAAIKRFNRYFIHPHKKRTTVSTGKRGPIRKYDVLDRKVVVLCNINF